MTFKNNGTPLISNIKLYVSFHHHMWIQIGVTVRKQLSWVVTSVTLTFYLWPWPFAWTLPWSLVITSIENFMMIRWWEHSQKGVTDGQTYRRTENTIHRAAWSQLKIITLSGLLFDTVKALSLSVCLSIGKSQSLFPSLHNLLLAITQWRLADMDNLLYHYPLKNGHARHYSLHFPLKSYFSESQPRFIPDGHFQHTILIE